MAGAGAEQTGEMRASSGWYERCKRGLAMSVLFASFGSAILDREETRRISGARAWLLGLAVMFSIGGALVAWKAKQELDHAERVVAGQEELAASVGDDLVRRLYPPETGASARAIVAERGQRRHAIAVIMVVNNLLAAIMFGLAIWAGRRPLAALVTALVLFGGVAAGHLIGGGPWWNGIATTIGFVVAAVAGIQATLARRRRLAEEARRVARLRPA